MATVRQRTLPSGLTVHLVHRDQLRFKQHGRTLKVPYHLRGLADQLPTPPRRFSGSKNRQVKYPILGNDQKGDCYYTTACHGAQTWTGQVGAQAQFSAQAVINRYTQLSGGDNGLGDQDIFPEWKAGIVGPNGPHKILDEMTCATDNFDNIALGMYLFCGCSVTMALGDVWYQKASAGVVWDTTTPDENNGHAMHGSGYVRQGTPLPYALTTVTGQSYAPGTPAPFDFIEDETWGFDPAVALTHAGLRSADPEIVFEFSLEMFNAQGYAPHCNLHYVQLAQFWQTLGGKQLPPSPFPAPTPTPPRRPRPRPRHLPRRRPRSSSPRPSPWPSWPSWRPSTLTSRSTSGASSRPRAWSRPSPTGTASAGRLSTGTSW
jgi:hypothetical protein